MLTFLLLLSVDHDSIDFDCFVVIVIGIWHSFCYCCCCGKAWWLFLLCWQHRSFIAVHSLLLLLASLSLSLMPLLLVFVDSIVIPLLTSYSWLLLSMLTLLVLLYLMVMLLGVLLLYMLERSLSGSLLVDCWFYVHINENRFSLVKCSTAVLVWNSCRNVCLF